jgi:hypothetical protein
MTQQRVLQFEYQQSLVQDSDRPGWSEEVTVSVRLLSDALTSGWYRERFGNKGNDFVILIAIAMHARPLKGDDLALLVRLGMATSEDDGRLYARVTDLALADELGISAKTILRATQRLMEEHAIKVIDIPDANVFFRDSHGRFNGSKVYLIAGDLQNRFLEKHVEKNDRWTKSPTVDGHRRTKSPSVEPHRWTKSPASRTEVRTNIIDEEDEEEERTAQIDQVFTYFAQSKGDLQYHPTSKELGALDKLLTDGFTIKQIIVGIDAAFSRPSRPRHFTHCAAIARDLVHSQQESRTMETRTRLANACQPEAHQPEALERTDQLLADTLPDPVEVIETALARAVDVYRSAGREITGDLLARFRLMAARCETAARVAGASGGDWLADALTTALGVARPGNLLNYADAVLNDWVANGRSEKPMKPATRSRSSNHKTPGRSREPGVNQGIIDYLEKHGGMPHGDPD